MLADLSADVPVYLLEGGRRGCENFFRDRIIARLKKLVLGEADPSSMNISTFYAPDKPAREAADTARSLSFFGGKNLVIIYGADRYREPDLRVLGAYIANPNPSSILVMAGAKFDHRKKFYKTAAKTASVISIEPPFINRIPEYINAYANSKSISITRQAVQNLVENIGSDLTRVLMEFDKLALFVGEGRSIDVDDVRELVGFSREESNFHLCEAVVQQDADKALQILSALKHEGITMPELVGVLRWQMERLWRAKDLLAQGAANDEVGRKLGIPPRFVQDFVASVRGYPKEKLRQGYEKILEADWTSREKPIDTGILLDLLMVSLCRN